MYNGLANDNIKGQVSAIISLQLSLLKYIAFVTFLEAYYEWMEQQSNAIEATRSARIVNDIDTTLDAFVTYFKEDYLLVLDSFLMIKKALLKNIKEFYQLKGTDKALILLFRMLFNEEVSVYYQK